MAEIEWGSQETPRAAARASERIRAIVDRIEDGYAFVGVLDWYDRLPDVSRCAVLKELGR